MIIYQQQEKGMYENETNLSAQQKKTGKNTWLFSENVNKTGEKSYQQAQGERKKAIGCLMNRRTALYSSYRSGNA